MGLDIVRQWIASGWHRRASYSHVLLATITLFVAGTRSATCGDAFSTASQVPPNPAAPLLSGAHDDDCKQKAISPPVVLFDAIERALCESPKTRSAWAAIREAAANVGISKSAYLPTLDGSVKYTYQHNDTQVSNNPQLQSSYAKPVNEESLALGWVLYDFGARSASLKSSQELLLAAQANQNATLQSIFASTAKAYFD